MNRSPILLLLLALLSAFMACDKNTVGSSLILDESTGEIVTVTKSAEDSPTTTTTIPQTTTADSSAVTSTETTTTETAPIIPVQTFTTFDEYVSWAENTGYPTGILQPDGVSGLNQDYFHTPPHTPPAESSSATAGAVSWAWHSTDTA